MSFAPVLSLLFRRNTLSRYVRPVTQAVLLCVATSWGSTALADTAVVNEVNQLLDQGKVNEAARRAQSHLKANPNDVQMRFLQGVIAAEQRKYDQAIQVFTALTQDFPGLPEPYNNLAVLYAAKGEERKAAQVLEQAIRTNPSYATAHENLGDLYARMASDAYAKALQLEGSRKTIEPKLSLIKQIFPASSSAGAGIASTASAAPTQVAAATPSAPVAAPSAAPSPAAVSTTQPAAPAVKAPESAHPPVAQPAEPEKTQPKVDEAKQAVAAVEKAVHAWAKAWEQQNMPAYYGAYSSQFDPQGSSLAAWKAERKERIVGKPSITLQVQDLKVSVQGDRATAKFRQFYASGGYKATTRKTLRLQEEGGKWRIIREDTGR